MKFSDFERFLKAPDLRGRRVQVRISKIVAETTHPRGKPTEALVAYFEGKSKGLILSPTNCRTLQRAFGDDVEQSVGQMVTLGAIEVQVAGRDRYPVRIAIPDPAPAPQEQTAAQEATATIQ
ncbi:MAG TPA: hypothetical protein VI756_02680 [Blastocatellia bacterium]